MLVAQPTPTTTLYVALHTFPRNTNWTCGSLTLRESCTDLVLILTEKVVSMFTNEGVTTIHALEHETNDSREMRHSIWNEHGIIMSYSQAVTCGAFLRPGSALLLRQKKALILAQAGGHMLVTVADLSDLIDHTTPHVQHNAVDRVVEKLLEKGAARRDISVRLLFSNDKPTVELRLDDFQDSRLATHIDERWVDCVKWKERRAIVDLESLLEEQLVAHGLARGFSTYHAFGYNIGPHDLFLVKRNA